MTPLIKMQLEEILRQSVILRRTKKDENSHRNFLKENMVDGYEFESIATIVNENWAPCIILRIINKSNGELETVTKQFNMIDLVG